MKLKKGTFLFATTLVCTAAMFGIISMRDTSGADLSETKKRLGKQTNKALIVLQENSGQIPLDVSVSPMVRQQATTLIDRLTETIEDAKTKLQASGKYDVVHLLTDNDCTRERLLEALVSETKKGRIIDLIVIGHGTKKMLLLKSQPHLTGGSNGNIRKLLQEAKSKGLKKINLRMVYMVNCYGSYFNDDWLAIGARVSIGSQERDMMPEPMMTFFIDNWVKGQKAMDAAKNAYEATIPYYKLIYPPKRETKYKTVEVKYPCPTFSNLNKKCKKKIQQPVDVDGESTPHPSVLETKLIVAGDGNVRY